MRHMEDRGAKILVCDMLPLLSTEINSKVHPSRSMTSIPPIIHIDNATVYRGNHKVFENLSLTLEQNRHTAILGPNGAGKTTLLKLITRETLPMVKENSACLLFGQDRFTIWDLRKKIGIVSQDFQNDYRALASGEQVVLSAFFGSVGIHSHNVPTESMRERARHCMQQLDIVSLAQRQYLHLSTGEQRRLLLARALVHEPQVLIFDEPTNGLDLKASMQILADMSRLARSGVTLILVTHHIHEIVPEIEQLVFLKNGAVVNHGNKEDLLTSQQISKLYDVPVNIHQHESFYQATPC
ncbi:iron complex transport system ATP-binding protein [Alteromonadaceae bacterium Bs31]|nr:iron complex transport system ATP-binding protein [Alteromonadaceae bacterium Bs31]